MIQYCRNVAFCDVIRNKLSHTPSYLERDREGVTRNAASGTRAGVHPHGVEEWPDADRADTME